MAIPPLQPPPNPGTPVPGQPVPSQPGLISMNGGNSPMPATGPSWMKPAPPEEKPKEEPDEIQEIQPTLLDPASLVGKVMKEFSDYRAARMPRENDIFLKAFLNHRGVYGGFVGFNGGTASPFVQITSPKCRTALAMLMQIIQPPGDEPWTLEPPAQPMMIDDAFELLQQGVQPEDIKAKVREKAEQACERLSLKVKGGLEESSFDVELLMASQDCVVYGTGFIEGPLAVENLPVDAPDEDGDLSLWRKIVSRAKAMVGMDVSKEDKMKALVSAGLIDAVKPALTRWSPFDIYLDPGAKTIEQCRSVVIRFNVSREQLREWRGIKGFDADAINKILNDAPDGNWKMESWESIIATGNDNPNQTMPNGRFTIYKRWGMVSGHDLREAGLTIPDDMLEDQVMAQAWISGDTLIRLSPSNELHHDRIPIYAVPYMISPESIYGMGTPEMMFDSQAAVNACERAKMDNMGFICRPQVMIRTGALDLSDTTEAIDFQPGKIWKIRETALPPNGMARPIDFWVPANALDEISKTQQESMQLADEQTAIPRFLMGQGSEGVHNRTLGGATLQFDRAITPFKAVVFNFDHFLFTPLITKMGRFYQLFSNDPSIKGDFKVVARGVQGLMAREILSQKIAEALQAIGNNPQLSEEASSVISPTKVLDKFIQGTGLAGEDLSYTPSEIAQRKAQAQQQQQQQAQNALEQAMAPKLRAETPPKDALLDLLKAAPDGSQSQMVLLGESAQQFGFMTPALHQALAHDTQAAGFQSVAHAHELGHQIAERDTTLPDIPTLPNQGQ